MAEDISQAHTELRQARQERLQRAADFWQRTLNEGRIARQAEVPTREIETPVRKQRGPYKKPSA